MNNNPVIAAAYTLAHPKTQELPQLITDAPELRPSEQFSAFAAALKPLTRQFNRFLSVGHPSRSSKDLQLWVSEYGPVNGRGYYPLRALGFSFTHGRNDGWYFRNAQHGDMEPAPLPRNLMPAV